MSFNNISDTCIAIHFSWSSKFLLFIYQFDSSIHINVLIMYKDEYKYIDLQKICWTFNILNYFTKWALLTFLYPVSCYFFNTNCHLFHIWLTGRRFISTLSHHHYRSFFIYSDYLLLIINIMEHIYAVISSYVINNKHYGHDRLILC